MAASGRRPRLWKSDLDKHVLHANFERRGWQPAVSLEDADVVWAAASGPTLGSVFGPEGLVKLRPGQLVNHFPNHCELTRKVELAAAAARARHAACLWRAFLACLAPWRPVTCTTLPIPAGGARPSQHLLAKNVKRYQRRCKEESSLPGAATATPAAAAPDFLPATFALPHDYALFLEEFKRQPDATWILKPIDKAQGKVRRGRMRASSWCRRRVCIMGRCGQQRSAGQGSVRCV